MEDDPIIEQHETRTRDGWLLGMRRTTARGTEHHGELPPRRPILIVPGYGMNSFIFGFHPRGRSLEAHLAWRGFEVWSVDLRGQGRSRRVSGDPRGNFGLAEMATQDVHAAVGEVLNRTKTGAEHVDIIGVSLGTAIMFAEAVVTRDTRLGSLVAFGGPLRWDEVHPAVKIAFGWPALAGAIPMRGTRALAKRLLPILQRVPSLLSIYVNPSVSDVTRADEMVQTVEDPVRQINREIAEWIGTRDLFIHGVNVTQGVASLENALLTVVAMGDGIVPPETARSPHRISRAKSRELLEIGHAGLPIAHADLFISNEAHGRIFDPLARWLSVQTP